jgi:hypothetical protein
MTKWWGRNVGAVGWQFLLYDWAYSPLMRYSGIEPWSPTWYGCGLVVICIGLNTIQIAVDAHPRRASI